MTEYQLEEIPVGPYKHLVSERAVTGETMLLNMGPQHPSTHGVLRLLLELDGEIIVNCIPDIGFLHTGVEKNMEAKTFLKAEVMCDRLDYMNPLGNNLAYCIDPPPEPAENKNKPESRAALDNKCPYTRYCRHEAGYDNGNYHKYNCDYPRCSYIMFVGFVRF